MNFENEKPGQQPLRTWKVILLSFIILQLGTLLSLLWKKIPGIPFIYFPVVCGILLVLIWRFRILPVVYINAVISQGLLNSEAWYFWPLYAVPETLVILLFCVIIIKTKKKYSGSSIKESISGKECFIHHDQELQRFLINLQGIAYQINIETIKFDFIYGNVKEITGYAAEDFTQKGLSWFDIVHPEDKPLFKKEKKALINESGYISRLEYRLLRKNGEICWVYDTGQIINKNTGSSVCLQGVLYEITERKAIEAALKISENKYRLITENANALICEVDVNGQFLYANSSYYDLLGYTQEALKTLTPAALLHPDDIPAAVEAFEKLVSQNDSSSHVWRFRHKDGHWLWFLTMGKVYFHQKNEKRIVTISYDISDKIMAEKEKELNTLRFEALYNLSRMIGKSEKEIKDYTLEESVHITGSKIGYLFFLNEDESILTIHSWSNNVIAACDVDNFSKVYKIEDTGLWGEAVRQRRPVITNDYEAENPFKKGCPEGHVPLKRHMNIPLMDNGRIVLVAGVGNKTEEYEESDVKHLTLLMDAMWTLIRRKKDALAMKGLNEEMKSKNLELEQVLFITSHDLRSPLVNIQGFTSELVESISELKELFAAAKSSEAITSRMKALFAEDIPESVKFINTSIAKMNTLLKGLQRLSRLGRTPLNIVSLDMNGILKDIINNFKYKINSEDIEIHVEELPDCRADEAMISHVFSNLIDNAIKYLDKERNGRIRVGGRKENGRSIYYVEDNGIGIEAKSHHKIFELFLRIDPAKTEGQGMGMTIVKKALERLKGFITLESKPGEGAKFTISLPCWDD